MVKNQKNVFLSKLVINHSNQSKSKQLYHLPPSPIDVNKRIFEQKLTRRKRSLKEEEGLDFVTTEQSHRSYVSAQSFTAVAARLSPPAAPMERSTSFDTKRSTPKASCRSIQTEKMNNTGVESSVSPFKSSTKNCVQYALPPSINFLALMLPSDHQSNTTDDKIREVNDASTTVTSTTATDCQSVTSGQTTLAKDRVRETIACSIEAEQYLESDNNDNSPKSVHGFHSNGPVNVDFVLESNEFEIASFVNSLLKAQQYDEAIDVYLTVLGYYKKQFGSQYPLVVSTIHNLGIVYVLKGNYNKALSYCQKALNIRKKVMGANHPDVVSSLCELGIICYGRENFNQALDAFRQALHIACHTENYNHRDCEVASILNNIGCVQFSMGKLIASIATFEESLNIQRNLMGSVTSDNATSMLFNMSITLCNAGISAAKHHQLEVASSLVEESLLVQQSILPDESRFVKATSLTLSNFLGEDDEKSITFTDLGELEINLIQQLSTSSQQHMNDALAYCSDMLIMGSVRNGGHSGQQFVSNSMQFKYLAHLLLNEGNSKRHCSWVDVSDSNISIRDKNFNLSQVCEKASHLIQVS